MKSQDDKITCLPGFEIKRATKALIHPFERYTPQAGGTQALKSKLASKSSDAIIYGVAADCAAASNFLNFAFGKIGR